MPRKSTPKKRAPKTAAARKSAPRKPAPKKRKPFRSLYQDGVTYSFLEEWLGCREQGRLSYVEGYRKTGLQAALEFGTLFHSCLEGLSASKYDFTSDWQKIVMSFLQKEWSTKRKELKRGELSEYDLLYKMAAALFPLYVTYWQRNKAMEFSPKAKAVYQEKSFRMEHLLRTVESNGLIPIRGRWDAVLLDSQGDLWVQENKTRSQIDEEGMTAYLSHDMQTMMYAYSLLRHLETEEAKADGLSPSMRIRGIIYNVIKRPQHRQSQKESQDEFVARVQAEVASNPAKYFKRWHVTLHPGAIENWVETVLDPIIYSVKLWWDSISANPFDPWSLKTPHHFRNPAALYTKYGRSGYFELLTRGSTFGLKRR